MKRRTIAIVGALLILTSLFIWRSAVSPRSAPAPLQSAVDVSREEPNDSEDRESLETSRSQTAASMPRDSSTQAPSPKPKTADEASSAPSQPSQDTPQDLALQRNASVYKARMENFIQHELDLTPERIQEFKHLNQQKKAGMAEFVSGRRSHEIFRRDVESIDRQIEALLGPERWEKYRDFRQALDQGLNAEMNKIIRTQQAKP